MSIGLAGHSFAFTIGRGNEIQRVAIDAFADVVLGRSVDSVIASPGELWSATVGDSQFRWLGPEKGVVHMAAGALLNAVWDLRARVSGRPLWLLLAEMDPAEVVEAVPFDHIEDAITPDDALAILRERAATRADRIETLLRDGYPAYTTTPGWLGYSDEKMTRLAKQVVADGFRQIKLKVGADLDDDVRRTRLAREAIGDSVALAVDANQVWAAHEAGPWINALEPARLAWVEEPTHPDDVLGHQRIRDEVRPIPIATGEHCANRVMFKQFLQADAIDIVQLDAHACGRCQREPGDHAARGKVRQAGVPSRWRGRAVRARSAPGDVRLHRNRRLDGGSLDRIRRPSPRALRRPRAHRRRALSGTGSPGDVGGDGRRRSPRLQLSRRREVARHELMAAMELDHDREFLQRRIQRQ